MIRRLIILLLIVGCDEEDSVYICGLCNSSNVCYCYTDVSEDNCSIYAAEADSLVSNGVRLRVIGDLGPFGTDVLHLVQDTERRTASNHKLELVIAVNYGGRWDIVSACRRLAMKAVEGKLSCDAIDEQCVSEALSTSTLPDPDLCIRTGGEYRISNFLLWQLAYTELYFTETLWPEFTEDDFVEALNWYATRQRRFGKIQEQVRVS